VDKGVGKGERSSPRLGGVLRSADVDAILHEEKVKGKGRRGHRNEEMNGKENWPSNRQ